MANKTVAIYFDEPEAMGYPFDTSSYFSSYATLSKMALDNGLQLYIVRGDSYNGQMVFQAGWKFIDDQLVEIDGPFEVDLVYIKGVGKRLVTGNSDRVINKAEFDLICHDKLKTYEAIGEFMAPSYAISKENWQEVVSKIKTDKIVLKPVTGAGGKGIFIVDTATFDFHSLDLTGEYLAQDFVDTSKGIPGIVNGHHDLRIIFFGTTDKIVSYIRQPQAGSLLANATQGATVITIELKQIPAAALEIAKKIKEKFHKYAPMIFSVDFLFENGKPIVGELNSRPGLPRLDAEGVELVDQFYPYLINALVNA